MTVRPNADRKTVFLSAITSDIGVALAKRYAAEGYIVAGTYRSTELLPQLEDLPECHLSYCDLADRATIDESTAAFAELDLRWETFISCACWPLPLSLFFDGDFDEWSRSVRVNVVEQLRVLHGLYPFRNSDTVANVAFFAGPGTNSGVKNFSALAASKLMLIKVCELLHAENEDLNVFIVGPGWTKTKTHDVILADPSVTPEKRRETLEFMSSDTGTTMDDIYSCIRWLSAAGRPVAGGRNFSVVHDHWGAEELAEELTGDPDMYKLRRYRNEWKERER